MRAHNPGLPCAALVPAGVVASDAVRASLPCPSTGYWLAAAAMAPFSILVVAGVRHDLVKRHCHQQSAGSNGCPGGASGGSGPTAGRPLQGSSLGAAPGAAAAAAGPGDVVWTPRATIMYPLLCTFAGLVAGTFGVGGGIVKVMAAGGTKEHPGVCTHAHTKGPQ